MFGGWVSASSRTNDRERKVLMLTCNMIITILYY